MILKLINIVYFLFLRLKRKVVFVNFFAGECNVGDLLNLSLVEYYSDGKKAVCFPGIKNFKHFLIVGSIIDSMNKNSVVLGSGTNDILKLDMLNSIGQIKALRGHITKNIIERKFDIKLNVALGDFALLYPRIYNPPITKKFKVGLILHYADEGNEFADKIEKYGGKIISVKQDPKSFVNSIKECECILSSSMHGVILSDAYQIPNKQIILSNNIIGADIKFSDYYSTTDKPNEKGITIDSKNVDIALLLKGCSIKRYLYNVDILESIIKEQLI